MITRITRRIIFIALVVLAVPVQRVPPLPFSQLTVGSHSFRLSRPLLTSFADQKQARDLVAVLTEAKQQIDPRLAEMTRYGGGGGGGGRYGGGGGYRGGRGGGRGGGKSLAPFSPVPSLMELTRPLVNRRFHLFQLCSSRKGQTLVEIPFTVEHSARDRSIETRDRPSNNNRTTSSLNDDEMAFYTGR